MQSAKETNKKILSRDDDDDEDLSKSMRLSLGLLRSPRHPDQNDQFGWFLPDAAAVLFYFFIFVLLLFIYRRLAFALVLFLH